MQVELNSPCKVNLILNILGKRADGFHELETVMLPVPIFDRLTIKRAVSGIQLTCDHPDLPTDSRNLVYRAAELFLSAAKISDGVDIGLEKKLPLAAGLGGGSANAAFTLRGLNQVFESALDSPTLDALARSLGSDVPLFLQDGPALGVGRGEQVTALQPFQALRGKALILIHPGFGVSTPWAYKNLGRFAKDLNGTPGRARRMVESLTQSIEAAAPDFYNSLEAPVLEKFPLLRLFQEFLRAEGALIALMSGSGSSTFAICSNETEAGRLVERFRGHFGDFCWIAQVMLP